MLLVHLEGSRAWCDPQPPPLVAAPAVLLDLLHYEKNSGDWRMGVESACFKEIPSWKGGEWDNEVCSSAPLARDEVGP